MILSQNQRGFKCKVGRNGIYKKGFFLANKSWICYCVSSGHVGLLEKEDK